ncbi:MAG: radical SAM protein [Candidatus Nitrosotenuis sp.]
METFCVLIYPKTAEIEFAHPDVPYSIFFLGSYIKSYGIQVKLFDQRVTSNDEILQFVKLHPVTHVGLSTMTGPQILYAMDLSKKIKKIKPDVKTIWGGIHVTVNPSSVLNHEFIDYIVVGEGEKTLLELLLSDDKAPVKGALYKDDSLSSLIPREFIDLDTVSLDWSLINPSDYISVRNGYKYISFVASRGCAFKCQYCYNSVTKNTWRSWSIEKVEEEIDKITQFNISYISFMDDNLAINPKWLSGVCEILSKRGIHWYGDLRASSVTENNMDRFKNCMMLFIGAESGSQRILNVIDKRIKVEEIYSAANVLNKRGIRGTFSWIIGFPQETREDVMATIKAVKKVSEIMPSAVQRLKIFSPYPGSKLYEETVKRGYKPPQTLEEWGRFTREYCALPYIKNPWWYKCISYVTFFKFYGSKEIIGSIGSSKPVYRPIIAFFKFFSAIRWRLGFFHFPIEFIILEFIRRLFSRIVR